MHDVGALALAALAVVALAHFEQVRQVVGVQLVDLVLRQTGVALQHQFNLLVQPRILLLEVVAVVLLEVGDLLVLQLLLHHRPDLLARRLELALAVHLQDLELHLLRLLELQF